MKKSIQTFFMVMTALFITLVSMIPKPITINAAPSFDIQAKSAILVDAETGKILYEKEADIALPPASMTKMMTEYLVLEAIKKGQISMEDTQQLSDYAYSLSANSGFSGYFLRQDKDYTVRELYTAMAVNSDNATTVALAELIAGSEDNFVKMMNEKAKELGLPEAIFVNSTGLSNKDLGDNYPKSTSPDANNYLTAKSAALLAYHLTKDFPEVLDYTSIKEYDLEGQSAENWNKMLPGLEHGYDGVDGLKTGYTDLAGYCFTGTAEKNGHRLISVVMKTESEDARFQETKKLLDYGFNNFEIKEIYPTGYQIENESSIPVVKGKEKQVEIATNQPIKTTVKKGEENLYKATYQFDESLLTKEGELTAPIKEGDVVGTMNIEYTGEENYGYITDSLAKEGSSVAVIVKDDVEKANWFVLTLRAIGDFFSDLFSSIVNGIKGIF